MSIQITMAGVQARCDTPGEAASLIRLLSNGHSVELSEAPHRGRGRPPANGHTPAHVQKSEGDCTKTLLFLKLLQDNPSGASSADIAKALDIRDTRGVGGVMVRVKRVIAAHGFQSDDIFKMRGIRGNRRWKPCGHLPQAIAKIGAQGGDDG